MHMESLTCEISLDHPPRNWKHRHKKYRNILRDVVTFLVTCIFCLVTGLFGALVSTPTNVAVLKGQEVTFHCATNTTNRLLWSILLPGATSEVLIFDGFDVNKALCFCSVKFANQESTLYIPANESSAARYTCAEVYFGAQATVQLTVLESDPVCGHNSTDHIVILMCTVIFSGHWSPVVGWMLIVGQEEKEVTDEAETTFTPFRRIVTVFRFLSVPANRSATAYKCTVQFSSSTMPMGTTAKNVPSYNFSWIWSYREEDGYKNDTKQWESDTDAQSHVAITGIVVAIVATFLLATACILAIFVWKRKWKHHHDAVEVPLHAEGGECTEPETL